MKGRKHKATGGDATSGKKEWEEDLKTEGPDYSGPNNVDKESRERKDGGRAMGKKAKGHAGRKPRKAGGKVGSDAAPFSRAHSGKSAGGRKAVDVD